VPEEVLYQNGLSQELGHEVVRHGNELGVTVFFYHDESVYVREPGGILIEIATDTGAPFPVNEAAAGTVSLPPNLESKRAEIEDALPSLAQ